MDPWREIAAAIKADLDEIEGIGVVRVGHLPELESWSDWLEEFTTETVDGDLIQGWQIVEPMAGNSVQTTISSINSGVVEDRLTFQVRGFRAMEEVPAESQSAFRDLAWQVKKALDRRARFAVTDTTVIHALSYPSSGSTVLPMMFGNLEAWGADLTKVVVLQRTVELQ